MANKTSHKITVKKIIQIFGLCILGILLVSLLVFLFRIVSPDSFTYIYENTRFFHTAPEIKSLSSAARHHEYAAEMVTEKDFFFQMAKKENWDIKPIGKYPFKIIRYTFVKFSSLECKHQILNGTVENETKESCYHFIKNGYYYLHETGNQGFVHVAYDEDNETVYVYYYRRGACPYKEQDMNPAFFGKNNGLSASEN
jgi:hypothetical protein